MISIERSAHDLVSMLHALRPPLLAHRPGMLELAVGAPLRLRPLKSTLERRLGRRSGPACGEWLGLLTRACMAPHSPGARLTGLFATPHSPDPRSRVGKSLFMFFSEIRKEEMSLYRRLPHVRTARCAGGAMCGRRDVRAARCAGGAMCGRRDVRSTGWPRVRDGRPSREGARRLRSRSALGLAK
jgi:hypothetical protein